MSRTPEQRIREFAADLAPVRPLPRLRWLAAAAVALWLAATAIEWLLGGPPLRRDAAWQRPGFLGVLVSLAAVAAGATGVALASAVPGRETGVRVGWGLAGLGALGIAVFGLFAVLVPDPAPAGSFALPWFCIGRAGWLGALPALGLAGFAGRAFATHASRTALAACLGALALGALVVQGSCLAEGALHVWLGHAVGPALLAALLAIPCALWLRRRGRPDDLSHESDALATDS